MWWILVVESRNGLSRIVNSILSDRSTDFRIVSDPFRPKWPFGENWTWLFGVPGEKTGPFEAILFDLHENLDPNIDCVPIILSFLPMKSDKPRIVPLVESLASAMAPSFSLNKKINWIWLVELTSLRSKQNCQKFR